MTKTEMRKAAGISTNTLAKMGKNEPITMSSLASIATTLQCGLDNIVEVTDKQLPTPTFEAIQYGISDATLRNWRKLNIKPTERLTARANKRKSIKRITPLEYISNKESIEFVQTLLDYIDENNTDIMSAIFSLGISLLKKAGIHKKQHVITTLNDYSYIPIVDNLVTVILPDDELDILGLIYQSFLQEGQKNVIGSYYTPQKTAHNMVKDFDFSNGELFLDPCCGSGAFLLSVAVCNPNQIFGIDNDRVAVLISKINLLIKYKTFNFSPQVYCFDFLMDNSTNQQSFLFEKKFDYIATNPPWGR